MISCLVRLFLITDGELAAALRPPASENCASTFRGHAGTETELSCSSGFAGLIRPYSLVTHIVNSSITHSRADEFYARERTKIALRSTNYRDGGQLSQVSRGKP